MRRHGQEDGGTRLAKLAQTSSRRLKAAEAEDALSEEEDGYDDSSDLSASDEDIQKQLEEQVAQGTHEEARYWRYQAMCRCVRVHACIIPTACLRSVCQPTFSSVIVVVLVVPASVRRMQQAAWTTG